MKIFMALIALGVGFGTEKWFPIKKEMKWDGIWGDWGILENCYGDYATSFKVRTEHKVHDYDDTALNSVCLTCKSGREICSRVGYWGDWYTCPRCWYGFDAGQFRFEDPQGSGDDTAGNTLLLRCIGDGKYLKAWGAPDNWGRWSKQACPYGSRICGLQTRVEKRHGGGVDDTALNGIRFICCATVVRVEVSLSPIFHSDGGSGSTSYTRIFRKVQTGVMTSTRLDTKQSFEITTHVGLSVNYGSVSGDGSIDITYLRDTFKSVIAVQSENRTEEREFKIFHDRPTYIYQAQSIITMSDGSRIQQGSPFIILRNSSIQKTQYILYRA